MAEMSCSPIISGKERFIPFQSVRQARRNAIIGSRFSLSVQS